jgi:hypothetical protein
MCVCFACMYLCMHVCVHCMAMDIGAVGPCISAPMFEAVLYSVQVCMHVCMYVCILFLSCVFVCMRVCVYFFACMYLRMHVCIRVFFCLYVSSYACMHTCIFLLVCMFGCMYLCVCLRVYICRGFFVRALASPVSEITSTHLVYTCIHIHKHTQRFPSPCPGRQHASCPPAAIPIRGITNTHSYTRTHTHTRIRRGFLLPALAVSMRLPVAIPVSSILFAVHHLNLGGVIPLSVLGFAWAVVYTQSRNLLVTILIHALWNSRVFLGSFRSLFIGLPFF